MFYAKGFTPLEKIILVRKNSLTGFTLIEVMIVVIIIGILASIALPLYSKVVERGRITEAVRMLGAIRDAERQYAAEYGNYSDDIDQLGIGSISQGKYFYYGYASLLFPNPDPYNNIDEILAGAARRNLSVGVYTGGWLIPGIPYVILITENGALISDVPEVNRTIQMQ